MEGSPIDTYYYSIEVTIFAWAVALLIAALSVALDPDLACPIGCIGYFAGLLAGILLGGSYYTEPPIKILKRKRSCLLYTSPSPRDRS